MKKKERQFSDFIFQKKWEITWEKLYIFKRRK